MKIMMIANDTNFAWNLRREVLINFIKEGHRVYLVSHILGFEDDFKKIGVHLIDVKNDRRGTDPLADLKLLKNYFAILKKVQPKIVFTNNIKPNVYAGLACSLLRINYVPNITGLGTPIENPGPIQKLSIFLYKLGVKKASTIFFQNKANIHFFHAHKMMPKKARIVLLPGSGVNLEAHPILPWPEGKVHFLFAARILKEKGIDYFLKAADRFANEDIVFDVCGQCDDKSYLEKMENNKNIVYHGLQSDMLPFYSTCTCFLYPSFYPEGMSNVLLEAAACGRPVITTDRPGCKEIVEDGLTGYVVPIKDEEAVLNAVHSFLKLDHTKQKRMGLEGRKKIEREFDRNIVIKEYIYTINSMS